MTLIEGYGASLEYDDTQIVIHLGKAAGALAGTKSLRVPRAEIADIKFRDASMMVNGEIRFTVAGDPNGYSDPPTTKIVAPNAFVVHFRKKDRDAFTAAYADLTR